MAVLTSNYPTSLDTTTTLGEVSNRAKTTLAVSLADTGETQISLTDGSLFPNSGVVTIDNEIFYYSSKATHVITIEARARQSTTAASHSSGALVYLRATKGHYEVLRTSIINLETKLGIGSADASSAGTNTILTHTGSGSTSWQSLSTLSIMVGPASASDNAIVRFDGTTGKLVQNSSVGINDSGYLSIGTVFPQAPFQVLPILVSGTASQSGSTVTAGSGTPFAASMVGRYLIFANGTVRTITGYTSTTVVTVSGSGTVSSQAFTVNYKAFSVDTAGNIALGTTSVPTGARMYLEGASTGANFDIRAGLNSGDTDQAILELQNADFDSTFGSTYLYNGGTNATGTTVGITNVGLGALIFQAKANALIASTGSVPIIFAPNFTTKVTIEASTLRPSVSDGTALGTSTYMWSDLFLASGGVINFNNGNLTVTHSSGALTVSGTIAASNLSGTNTGDQTTITGNAGTATALATARAIYGNNFDGTAALTQIIASTYGGTGNGFTAFTGPTTTEKIFTLPNASATILTDNALVTSAQGGTGVNNGGRTLTISTNSGTISFTTAVTLTVAATASVSGTNTGDQTTVTGNAGTATALQNARTIGGVSFDGTANITVATATGGFTVSGGDLALSTNSITMTGSLAATGARVTKGWFTDVESTNMYTVGGTSLSSTFSAIAGSASIVTVGTIGTGTWQGTVISPTYGGTGVNNSTRTLTISSNSGTIVFPTGSTTMTFPNATATLARTDAGQTFTGVQTFTAPVFSTPVINGISTGTGVASVATVSTLALRDTNGNAAFVNTLDGYTTTATAAGTTTLTVASNSDQYFTGSTTQTVALPVATTLVNGQSWWITNNSTGAVTVNTSGGNQLLVIAAGTNAIVSCINTAGDTGTASWSYGYFGDIYASGKKLTVNNTLTFSGTDGTTMTFPSTTATIARTDAAQTFTGVQTFSTPIATGSVATMTATVGGGVPTPPNNTTTFLRGDGTFATPSGGGGGITWTEVTGTTQAAAVDNGYITNNASQVVVTIPTTAAVGKVVRIAGKGAGGWRVSQNASEKIYIGGKSTTTGTGGYLASTQANDAVELLCIVADTEWEVISVMGNITYV